MTRPGHVEAEQRQRFGTQIRLARERAGLGLRELARRINVSPAFLSTVERGESAGLPGEDTVLLLAQILGLNSDFLLALIGRLPSDIYNALVGHILANPTRAAAELRAWRSERTA
jgi:transcriptional regulator with XRE-family HTH domain